MQIRNFFSNFFIIKTKIAKQKKFKRINFFLIFHLRTFLLLKFDF